MHALQKNCTIILIFVLLLNASLINAQTNALLCDDDAVCVQLRTEAREHSKTNHFEEARNAYSLAYQRRADPMLLFNLARVLHKAKRPAEAVEFYQKYLASGAEGSAELRQKTQEYIEQARREAQSLPPTSSPETITPPLQSSERQQSTPIYRKWWLWTAITLAVTGVAIGVGVGVAARRPDLTDVPTVRPFPANNTASSF